MGMVSKVASLVSKWTRTSAPAPAGAAPPPARDKEPRGVAPSDRNGSLAGSMVHPSRPVALDLEPEEDKEGVAVLAPDEEPEVDAREASDDRPSLPSPRNKQELIAELQKNYAEVLELVRKVNAHLDRQEDRSARLMAIVDRLPNAIDSLDDLRGQNDRLLAAVERSAEVNERNAARVGDAVERQSSSMTAIGESLEKSRQTELQLVQTMAEFRSSVGDMAGAGDRVGKALETLHASDQKRQESLLQLVDDSRRWTMGALIACGGVAGMALFVAVIALIA